MVLHFPATDSLSVSVTKENYTAKIPNIVDFLYYESGSGRLLGKLISFAKDRPKAIERSLRALGDLTGTTSDALDECGIAGVALLRPTDPRARIVGQAVTVLNVALKAFSFEGTSRLADIEAHNLAEPGDVLVVQGVAGISSMGAISASVGRRQGEAGAVVDGAAAIGLALYALCVAVLRVIERPEPGRPHESPARPRPRRRVPSPARRRSSTSPTSSVATTWTSSR